MPSKRNIKRSIHIDADYLIYRHGFAAQKTVEIDGVKNFVLTEEVDDVLDSVQQALDGIIFDTQADKWSVYIGGNGNYREDVAKLYPYKGNRDNSNRPILYKEIKTFIKDNCGAIVIDGQEADDSVSIGHIKDYWEFSNGLGDYSSTIVSNDKDLSNTYGWHYNPVRKESFFVSMMEAERNFYTQLLSGDSGDNIPGLFKLTGTKASKKIKQGLLLLRSSKDMYEYVYNIYNSLLKDTDMKATDVLTEIGQLLWIRRIEDEYWTPPISRE